MFFFHLFCNLVIFLLFNRTFQLMLSASGSRRATIPLPPAPRAPTPEVQESLQLVPASQQESEETISYDPVRDIDVEPEPVEEDSFVDNDHLINSCHDELKHAVRIFNTFISDNTNANRQIRKLRRDELVCGPDATQRLNKIRQKIAHLKSSMRRRAAQGINTRTILRLYKAYQDSRGLAYNLETEELRINVLRRLGARI